jgi:acetyl-CoA carboxylase carboxyl transferase subunit alpha
MVIAQQKGRDLKERTLRNFGYPRPDGYRKALRLMKLAEKLGLPIVTLIDCPAADTNVVSEERGICDAIARNLLEMSLLQTPIVGAVLGEGGSGGALALAVSDRIVMFQHAIFSVIPPEGCAAILETFGRDPNRKDEAAIALRLTANDALRLGLIDEVLPEPLGGAHRDPDAAAQTLGAAISRSLDDVERIGHDSLLEARYARYRNMGVFNTIPSPDTETARPTSAV